MFNWDTRYANLLQKWGMDLEKGSILEVGCGPQGIARYLSNNVTGLELHKIQSQLRNLQIVEGDITSIPFPDNEFDYVICSDVLEHLPRANRLKAIAETIRVAKRKCFIQGPHGNVALNTERILASSLARYGMNPPAWLTEHLANGLPVVSETIKGIVDTGFIPNIKKNEGIVEHYGSVVLDLFFPELLAYQKYTNIKGQLSELRSAGSDEPYSLLIMVDKQRALGNAVDPFLPTGAPVAPRTAPRTDSNGENVTLFSVHHKFSELAKHFTLIREFDVTGRASNTAMGLKDPEGFLEEKNDRCSEISAFHYVWKRQLYGDIVGFCHYRRFLYLFPDDIKVSELKVGLEQAKGLLPRIEDKRQIHDLLNRYDLLVARPITFMLNQVDQYARSHVVDDYFAMVECIIEQYPLFCPALVESMSSTDLYGTNLVICRKELFEIFCAVWFDVLKRCAARLNPIGRNTYQSRDIAFLSERVFDVLVRHLMRSGYRVCELPKVLVA